MTPARLVRPCVGAMPTRLLLLAGLRIDAPVSVAMPSVANPALTATPGPALEPPGLRVEIVRVQRLPAERADALGAEVELVEVRLEEDDRSRIAQLRDHRRVVLRERPFERDVAAGRRDVLDVDRVLHRDRNAVERAAPPLRPPLRVELTRDLQRAGMNGDDGIQLRPVPVVRLDALEVQPHQLLVGQLAGVDGRLNIGHAGREEIECSRRLRRRQRPWRTP